MHRLKTSHISVIFGILATVLSKDYLTDANSKEKDAIKQLRRRLFVAIEMEEEDAKNKFCVFKRKRIFVKIIKRNDGNIICTTI
jgi:hypothetical protein